MIEAQPKAMFRLLFLNLSIVSSAAAGILTPSPIPAKPKWTVDYAENRCILSRARLGAAGGLKIDSRPYEVDHELIFLLPKLGRGRFDKAGQLSVPDSRPKLGGTMSVEEPRDSPDRHVTAAISNEQLRLAAKETTLGVTIPGKLDEHVSVAGLAKALVALRACEENLAAKWGAPKKWEVDAQPDQDPRAAFTNNDYPESLVNAGQRGTARLLIKLDAAGQVAGCRGIEMTGPLLFAEVVCSVIKQRVKFTPALDAAGQAVPSYYVAPRVRFEIAD